MGLSPCTWVAFQPGKTPWLFGGARCIAGLGDPAWVVFGAAAMKTGLGTALQCGVFEEN